MGYGDFPGKLAKHLTLLENDLLQVGTIIIIIMIIRIIIIIIKRDANIFKKKESFH